MPLASVFPNCGPPAADPAQAVPQPDANAEEAEKKQERDAKIDVLIGICNGNRQREQNNFGINNAEFAKDEHWYSSSDIYTITPALNELKGLYDEWDKTLEHLRALYTERGE